MEYKTIIGLVEKVKIKGSVVLAKVDTGAKYNSICGSLAEKLKLGPVIKRVTIKTSNGIEKRPVIRATIELKGKKLDALFNITDRSHMKYDMLIGLDVLKRGFLVDPSQ